LPGGFFSDDDLGVIKSEESKKASFVVPAGQAVRFTLSTWDEYCEMVLHWSVRYRTATGGSVIVKFGNFKNLEDCEILDDVPALGGRAFIVPWS